MTHPLEQRLEQAFDDIQPGQLNPGFQDQVMDQLATRPAIPKRLSPAAVLSVYWLLATAATVVVLGRIGWLELQWSATTMLVTLVALALTVLPIVFFAFKVKTSILELIWNTVGD